MKNNITLLVKPTKIIFNFFVTIIKYLWNETGKTFSEALK